MSIFRCKMCGGSLEVNHNETVITCEYCGTRQTLPKLDDEKRANLYDRANHFRRNNEFDKAMGIYEQILNEDGSDAEAYWSLVLCKYGIEYVEDPATHKRMPTVNRTQYTSIFADADYQSALEHADGYQKSVYEEEAKTIDEIQKGILAISQKEEPFDVFICYKETDESGRRTQDSVLANDLYHQLTQEGFRVFFSRITLEDKLGTAYEPYIFAALNSAKVMVVIGTKAEYFNAVWVKNEWSRYLTLIKNGAQKMLIPAYRDMDPYDLPEEFSHLQAQDMSKLGFMQDLIRGIKKIAQSDKASASAVVKETIVTSGGTDTAPLLKRAFMFLEDGDFARADDLCEQVLNQDPENAQAYLGKLLTYLKVDKLENLKKYKEPFDHLNNYKKVLRFADDAMKKMLEETNAYIRKRNESEQKDNIYQSAKEQMGKATDAATFAKIAQQFAAISGWKDADALQSLCLEKAEIARKDSIYDAAVKNMQFHYYERAEKLFVSIPGWKDANEQLQKCKSAAEARKKQIKKLAVFVSSAGAIVLAFVILFITVILPSVRYGNAMELLEQGEFEQAATVFGDLGDYKNSAEMIKESHYRQAAMLKDQGEYIQAMNAFKQLENYKDAQEQIGLIWNNIAVRETVSTGYSHTVGLKTDGTVVATSEDYDVAGWADIVAVSAGYFCTVGLKTDGTVLAVGNNYDGQCNVSDWTDVVAISAGLRHTVGLKTDGTVVAVGNNSEGQCNVRGWTNIVAVSAGAYYTVGLKADGTVVVAGYIGSERVDIENWTDIVTVLAGAYHTVGLKADGTVVAVGKNEYGQCDVEEWTDIVAVSAWDDHTVGLKTDGTVVAVGRNDSGQCNVSDWTDIVAVSAGAYRTVGLKADGTVVVVGYIGIDIGSEQDDMKNWTDIKTPQK